MNNNKDEKNEIIIEFEIEISNKEIKKDIYILCNKIVLIEDKKRNKDFYINNNINPPEEFNYFNQKNTKLYLNDNEIEFNEKLNFNIIGTYKIKIISNTKLFSFSSMFYNCDCINKINFVKININNDTNMNYMFYNCINLTELDISSINTNNVNYINYMFCNCIKFN